MACFAVTTISFTGRGCLEPPWRSRGDEPECRWQTPAMAVPGGASPPRSVRREPGSSAISLTLRSVISSFPAARTGFSRGACRGRPDARARWCQSALMAKTRSRLPLGLVYDTGALIAGEANDRRMWAFHARALQRGVLPVVPAGCVVEAWRGGRQVCLDVRHDVPH